ncbi:oligosaccharide flippase family protein [Gloeobacter kilaueensis]|uniref:Polysaccharide biosynthesis protein n=1 Tax=Gloeobacter kilaueensis (strain ATCC BAA-2537 / CCAP 1431/1 / ULC 316 / JS1) TaxID=1183438 RepID=U5QFW3_GLOK1|nr:oligosaccharide flippase family protein [Gloeobacter kilaueensis]AGY56519.1 polysaccharide biosynthesis protein [Gloeobacter kilaueensis JS1]
MIALRRWLISVAQLLPLHDHLALGSLWLIGAFALTKGSQLITQILLSRLLVPSDFGLWAMVLVFSSFSMLFRDNAIAAVLVQRGLKDKSLVDAVYSLGINVSIGLFLLQALAGYPLSLFFHEPHLWLLTALHGTIFLLGAGAGSHDSVLLQQMRFKEIGICDTLAGVARLLGAGLCGLCGGGVWAFLAGEIAANATDAISRRAFSGYHFHYSPKINHEAIREVRSFIAGILSINLAVQLNTNGDNAVIGRVLGSQALGYYNVAYQLAMVPVFVVGKVNRVHFSALSAMLPAERQPYLTGALEKYSLIAAPVCALGFVLAPWLIPFLYGPDWVHAVILFQLVLGFAYVRGLMSILGTALNAFGKPGINALINWALVPLTIPAFILGAWLGGTTGVAVAVALVLGIVAAIWFWYAVGRVSQWSLWLLAKPVLFPTAAAATALFLTECLSLQIVAAATLFSVLYLLFVAVLLSRFSSLNPAKFLLSSQRH